MFLILFCSIRTKKFLIFTGNIFIIYFYLLFIIYLFLFIIYLLLFLLFIIFIIYLLIFWPQRSPLLWVGFSGCRNLGLLFTAGLRVLLVVASLVVMSSRHKDFSSRSTRAQWLWLVGSRAWTLKLRRLGLAALWYVKYSLTRGRTLPSALALDSYQLDHQGSLVTFLKNIGILTF